MKLSIPNLLEHWYGLVEYSRICKEDSISYQSFVSSQWCKILSAILLMIRLLFIALVSNAKLERVFSKLKRVKMNFRCFLSNFWKKN